jgi:pimeloyl-ACP methyl ester carboxylesterase
VRATRGIDGDGVAPAVVDDGDGPVVLLLHGFPCSSHAAA